MPMSPRLLRPRTGGFHPEASDWRSRVIANGGTVSGSTLTAVSNFCRSIDGAGIRGRFYRLNLFCGTGLSACLVPLYRGQSLTGTQFGNTADTNTNFVSGDYVETGATGGLKGNGTSKWLNTGFASSNFPDASSRHIAVYEPLKTTATFDSSINFFDGSTSAATMNLRTVNPATTFQGEINATTVNSTDYSGGAFWLLQNTSLTAIEFYKNAASAGTATAASNCTNNSSAILTVFARSGSALAATAADFSAARIASYSAGLSMTSAQEAAYYAALQAFQTSLGRNV